MTETASTDRSDRASRAEDGGAGAGEAGAGAMSETDSNEERPEPCQDAAFFKETRLRLGLSLRQASAKLGVSGSYLYQVERGDRGLSEGLRRKLLVGYGLMPTNCPHCDRMAARLKMAEAMLQAAMDMLRGERIVENDNT